MRATERKAECEKQLFLFLEVWASCRREECIVPPKTCNIGKLSKEYSVQRNASDREEGRVFVCMRVYERAN